MDQNQFRQFGKAAIDYIADYNENLRDREVLPSIEPGYLRERIPGEAPQKSESWQQVLDDVEKHIMPGGYYSHVATMDGGLHTESPLCEQGCFVPGYQRGLISKALITHWHSPHFHAYYPTGNSYPAIVGEMLSAGLGCLGISWISSPAYTELEIITMDWLAKMMGLPEYFLNSRSGPGGGCLQGSASETTFIVLSASRELTVNRILKENPDLDEGVVRSKLIAYTSDQSNSSVEKSGRLGGVPMKLLTTDEKCSLRGTTLLENIKKDIDAGFVPCLVVATLGTTATCSFDNLNELGPICNQYNIWLHVDAAYAGATFVCPEYRHLMSGIHYVDSFNFNPHKWLLVNFDCSALWVKDSGYFTEAFSVERIYLANNSGGLPDYRHWQISLGRRFRSLKLWFVMRLYGVEGLQKHIRHMIGLAKNFVDFVNNDDNFEIPVEPNLGLVCFRLKGKDDLTRQLLDKLMARRKIYVLPASYDGQLVIRFVICSRFSIQEDIIFSWNEISNQAQEILKANCQGVAVIKQIGMATNKKPGEISARVKDLEIKDKKQNSTFAVK